MGEIVGFSRLEILEEKGKKKKMRKSISSSVEGWKKSYEKNLHGFAKDFTGSPSNSLPEIPFKMDEYFFLFLSFFPPFFLSTIRLFFSWKTKGQISMAHNIGVVR